MQKKLIAVAVAGALGAPAIALAQSSTVQLYGKVTFEYSYVDQGNGKPNTDFLQTPGGSAVGVRGEEKLGGGLSAWFQCESSADVRGMNQDGFCTRNSALGLKGAFGNFHIGRWDTPFKRAMNVGLVGGQDTGVFGTAFVLAGSSTGTLTTANPATSIKANNRNVWRRRDANMIYYESPKFSGFQVLAGYTAGNAATGASSTTTSAKPRVASIAAVYSNGPLALGLGYEKHNEFGAVGGSTDDRGWTLNAAYTFMGKVKVGATYNEQKYENSATSEAKKKAWQVGVEWHLSGPHSIEAAYTKAKDMTGTATTTIDVATVPAPGPSTGARLWQVSYVYAFSKRTSAKFGYVKLDNDTNASYALGGTSVASPGSDQSAWATYWQHKF